MEGSGIVQAVSRTRGYDELPTDTRELIIRVISCFIKEKISPKVASKRIAALFGDEAMLPLFLPFFLEYRTGVPAYEISQVLAQKKTKRGVWSESEDQKLTEAVSMFGANNWKLVSEYVGTGRNKNQCAQRWERSLDPSISKDIWTDSETEMLIEAVKVFGVKSWVKVAKYVRTRSDVQCRYKYITTFGDEMQKKKSKIVVDPFVVQTKQVNFSDVKFFEKEDNPFGIFDKLDFGDDFVPAISF